MPLRLDGRLILVVVLTSYCIFCVCVCVCVRWFIISQRIRKGDLSAPLYTLTLLTVLLNCDALPLLGASADEEKGGEKESRRTGPGVSGEKRGKKGRIGGFFL